MQEKPRAAGIMRIEAHLFEEERFQVNPALGSLGVAAVLVSGNST